MFELLSNPVHRISSSIQIRILSYSAILETYSLEEILEMNDITNEDLLEFLVIHKYVILPEIQPIEF